MFIPELGKLYKFREDNKEYLCKKYNYYYVGLLLCTQVDILNDPILDLDIDYNMNPIFAFDVYNCIQHFSSSDVFAPEGIKINNLLFLTLSEVNDFIEPTKK